MEKILNDSIEVPINKITLTFPKKFYIKYDVLELNGTEYICISNPRENSGEWSIDVRPITTSFTSKFKYNNTEKLYQ